jgi:hypothetical protein
VCSGRHYNLLLKTLRGISSSHDGDVARARLEALKVKGLLEHDTRQRAHT